MNIFRTQRANASGLAPERQIKGAPKPGVEQLGPPKPATAADAALGQKIDGRKANKHVRTKQFNTKVKDGFLEDLDSALEQYCADKEIETVSRGYFIELLLYNWVQANGKEVRPYGLPPLALEHAEAIAARMNWSVTEAIEDAIAVRCKDLNIDLNEQKASRRKA